MTNNTNTSTNTNTPVDKEKSGLNPKIIVHILFIITTVIAYFFREKIVIGDYIKFQSIFLLLSLLMVLTRLYMSFGANDLLLEAKKLRKGDKENPFYKFWNNRKQILYLFFLLLPFFIPIVLVNDFVDKIVSQIFQKSNIVAYSVILIISLSGFLFIGHIRSKSVYIPSKTSLALLFLISTWTAYFEITSAYKYFAFFDGAIHLTFFIYLMTYLNLHFYLKSKYDNAKPQNKDTPFFLTDEEIGDKQKIEDKLGRSDYAKKIAKNLLQGSFKTSFAVGITGEWGAGKTSFISLMKDYLKEKEEILIVEFNPWNSQTSNQIIEDFFGVFQKKLSPYSSTISSEIMNYAKNLIDSNKGHWWILPKQIINYFDKPISIQDRFSHINKKLKIIDKKIFVIIDDLDRLDKEEVIEVIRLIRNTANFYNTCFIVGYDKGYVNVAIAGISDYRSEYFLEKIFQLEIVLPHVEDDFYVKELINKIESRIGKQEAKELKLLIENRTTEISIYNFYIIISSLIDSYRDIDRFINILIINYKDVKNDVSFVHFILIEALRYKYPLVIDTMYRQSHQLFEFDPDKSSVYLKDFGGKNKTLNITISEQDFEKIESNINKVEASKINLNQLFNNHIKTITPSYDKFISKFNLEERDKDVIMMFFKLIFVYRQNRKGKNLLNYPNSYINYFSYRISKDAISTIEFKIVVEGNSVDKFKEKIDEWLKSGKNNLEDSFYHYFPTKYEIYRTYIIGFLYAAKKIQFNSRMDNILEDKLPDLEIGDNKKELKNFFDKEFTESSKYPFVEELRYLNNLTKIHFYEEMAFKTEEAKAEREGYEEHFTDTLNLKPIKLFSIIVDYKYYVKEFIEAAGKIENLDSQEFKSFFNQVAGEKGWFRYVGFYDSPEGKSKFQDILKTFIEKHSENNVYKILLKDIQEEELIDNQYGQKSIIPFKADVYQGIRLLFENDEKLSKFLKDLKYNNILKEKEIKDIYHEYYREDDFY